MSEANQTPARRWMDEVRNPRREDTSWNAWSPGALFQSLQAR